MRNLNEIIPKTYTIESKQNELFKTNDRSEALTKFMNMGAYPYPLFLKEDGKIIHEKSGATNKPITTLEPINS